MLPAFPRLSAPARFSGDRRGTLINHILPLLPRATKRDGRWPQKQSQQEKTKNEGPYSYDLGIMKKILFSKKSCKDLPCILTLKIIENLIENLEI